MDRHSRIKQQSTTALGTIVAAMVVLIAGPVGATSIFTANLTGSQETPPNASPANGFGTFVLNEAMTQLSFNITYAGLIGGNLVGAHFHEAPVGVAGPIVRGLSLEGATSPSGSFTGVWTNVDAEPLTSTRVNALFAGLSYFNIHTTQFPGGEIRGQLEIIPEPTTLLLLASGLGALAAWRKVIRRMPKAES